MSKSPVLELQNLAQSDSTSVGELLRRATVIASKLGLGEFRKWCQKESMGYAVDDVFPSYRQVKARLQLKNPARGLIPFVLNDKGLKRELLDLHVHQPVDEICQVLDRTEPGASVSAGLRDDEIALLMGIQEKIQGFWLEPYRSISIGQMSSVLSAVRDVILNWALDLERDGILGEGLQFSDVEKQAASQGDTYHVGQLLNVGGSVSHSTLNQTQSVSVEAGSLPSLLGYLKTNGLDDVDLKDLRHAIEADPPKPQPGQLGERVQAWLGSMLMKASTGAAMIGTGAGGNLLADAVKAYYGW